MKPKKVEQENTSTALTISNLEKNLKLQHIIVVEHFFRKKGVEQLSKKLNISPLDLRFFINSVEAYNIYMQIKDQFQKAPKVDSIEELHEYLVDKLIEYLELCSPSEAGNLIEKVIPQIMNLNMAIKGVEYQQIRRGVEDAEFTTVQNLTGTPSKEIYTSPLELIAEKAKLYSKKEIEEIANLQEEKKDDPEKTENK